MTWISLVSEYHKKYRNKIKISIKVKVYFQSLVLKKILENTNYLIFEDIKKDDGQILLEYPLIRCEYFNKRKIRVLSNTTVNYSFEP